VDCNLAESNGHMNGRAVKDGRRLSAGEEPAKTPLKTRSEGHGRATDLPEGGLSALEAVAGILEERLLGAR